MALTDARTREEEQERRHLAETVHRLTTELEHLTGYIDKSARTIEEKKEHLWANLRDMDFAEKANFRHEVDLSVLSAEHAAMRRKRIERLLESPYFGRVDFHARGDAGGGAYYIGVHNFSDPATQEILIHDWRAPVSGLFYDFESGAAFFETPEGTAHGEITGKRQYKIVGGRLEYMLDSSLNIGDDVLQRELSQSADDRMKNIVATIQREQNAVIRNETARVLILQGVAGSGKTSIALHRVAFLLYRFKDTLSSDNVMILSPNRVFGDYIADVLPELGEQQTAEIDFDRIAGTFLAEVADYETFGEQVVKLIENVDEAAAERMRHKATPEFVTDLDAWITSRADEEFTPAEIKQKHHRLPAEWVAETFDESRNLPVFTRLDHLANRAVYLLKQQVLDRGHKWAAADTAGVRRQVRAMFPHKDALAMYKAFYQDPDRRGMFKPLGRKKIEYADVFPLIYTMIRTARQENYGHIRHLLVDEMQDYTPIQYAVLRELFSCTMTILGDSNQSVNPFSSSSLSTIHNIFPEADCLELCKSYRSTTEITNFAQNISRNDKLVPIERHGLPPQVIACTDQRDQQARILTLIEQHSRSEHRSLGIICKTVTQAKTLHHALSEAGVEPTFLDYDSTAFAGGIVLTSAHIAKGLEFDTVIVPHADEENYTTEMDRCMLYIACTRAMHELHLTHHGPLSRFLEFAEEPRSRIVDTETAESHDHAADARVS
ncbi:HelD family protein [Haloactinomyces albus]|uniref:DNA helicase-2/ATP-dependent DNA helicase PcrA n=1 Tax=Haloactinomyces albus TaxID=1352928 RepID=A0AAE3Z815_9ACTN|nr:UvrD-helicase domain-containing protein [Haloactinomyces albus]MDR7300062.1 DNA helicase-2/ATP-dependent DNA helicase PcrA [Haloactinomyces albus]